MEDQRLIHNHIRLATNDLEFIWCELKARWIKKKIMKSLEEDPSDLEKKEILTYLQHYPMTVFPYEFKNQYHMERVSVAKEHHLYYVMHHGKKLFLKSKYQSAFRAKRYYSNLCMEQDVHSPHRYCTDSFVPEKDCIIVDVGGAEGIFSLEYIEQCKHAYIFECDQDWIDAMKYTFAPYQDKITIIPKFVSNINNEQYISLDEFVKEYHLEQEKLFIKVDAEGSEPLIYEGMKQILDQDQKFCLALCTYHCDWHHDYFTKEFASYQVETTPGYMLYYYDMNYASPYLRRGVLRVRND